MSNNVFKTVVVALCLTVCSLGAFAAGQKASGNTEAKTVELTVFAAASLTETMERLAPLYKKAAPDVTLQFTFDSSGTLRTQIKEGAECDVFISAGQLQMDQIDGEISSPVNSDGSDFVVSGTRVDLLENKVVLCVPPGNPARITGFDGLAQAFTRDDFLFGMGNSDVPAGQYAQKILTYFNLDEEKLAQDGKISYGSNVKEVVTQIAESSVSCGVVYGTDAGAAALEIAGYATEAMCGRIIYPAAVINTGANTEAAAKFLDFLKNAEAMAEFEKAGFSPVR